MFSRPARKSSRARCSTASRRSEVWKAKSNSSIVLRAGNRAALMRGLAAVAVATVDLGLEQHLGEALVAPLLLARAVGELGQRPRRGRRLERPEQMRQLGRRPAHAIKAS
jgi:hypothetical protein